MLLAPERDAGYITLDRRTEGSVQTGQTERIFLRRVDENGAPRPFSTGNDTLEIGVIFHEPVPALTHSYPNSRTVFAMEDGTVLALAPHYTFIRVGEQGRISAFRRVADPVLIPDWWLEELRRDWMERRNTTPPDLRGYITRPYTMAVDENDHVWVIPDDGSRYRMASSVSEFRQIHSIALDEFDQSGIWLRHLIIELPADCTAVSVRAAAHGFLYGIVMDTDEVEVRRVIRFRRPGRSRPPGE
jgi:hypothetical protein